jgi:hypothetical protein
LPVFFIAIKEKTMDLLKALQQTMMPGNRIPRVGSWDELKQYPMPVDCEGVFIDRDPNKDYIYMKRTDANGGEVCARYRITEDPVQEFDPDKYVRKEDFDALKEVVTNGFNSVMERLDKHTDKQSNAAKTRD